MKKIDDITQSAECGCIYKKNGIIWRISEFCKQHIPNYAKKADKLICKKNKKRGRGYTTKQQKNVKK
jgi:hypothetical protein